VPGAIAASSAFEATINLGGNGVALTTQSQRIIVTTAATPPVELIAIAVNH
jgi:hypothetical protein